MNHHLFQKKSFLDKAVRNKNSDLRNWPLLQSSEKRLFTAFLVEVDIRKVSIKISLKNNSYKVVHGLDLESLSLVQNGHLIDLIYCLCMID